ncbi:MAG: TlpA family protein disulfide reductase [Chitinophagales bacterium]|nr:TlpA family protein disulfide reductase [Chitinophagales bacterium]
MKKVFFLLSLFISSATFSQDLQNVSVVQLNEILNQQNGKIKILNLWATWCGPCVKELPLFMQAKEELKNEALEFIFVSLDFQSQTKIVESKIKELSLRGSLFQLNEKGNQWIDEFDKNWEGAIPYTMIILPDGKRIYHYDNFETLNDFKLFLTNNISN